MGKSQLAAAYVHGRADAYDIVAWIRAEDGGVADLAALSAKLGSGTDGLAPGERAELALDRLSASSGCWLLVLDNVQSAQQLEGLLPRGGSGRVLVTSRDRALREFGPVLAVDVFEEDVATAYLVNRSERRDERGARRLARGLGCLPLALSHAAAYCSSGTNFDDYLELLSDLPARELFDAHPERSYLQTVASTWKASVEVASKSAPLAARVLETAAHLGPDAIPKSLFGVLVDTSSARERKRLRDAFNALARFSLATVDDETVSVHRLLQKTIREDCAARDDRSVALVALRAVDDAFPDDVALPECWPLCEQLLAHVIALADAMRDDPGDGGPQLVDLLNRVCYYLNWAEPGRRGLAMALSALALAEGMLGPEHPSTLTTRNRVASAYRHAGLTSDAIMVGEPLLEARMRIFGADDPYTLTTSHYLAYAYQDAGRSDDAIAIYEPLLADRERILGADHPETLATRNNLGRAYGAVGRIAEAIAILEPLLADRERILGDEHPSTLTSRHNLAFAYHHADRPGEAIAILEPLLADRLRILGADHPQTLWTRNNLGRGYEVVGRTQDAIAIYEPLVADRERIQGIDHPHTLTARHNLASAYDPRGRTDEAIAILEPLLADRERMLGAAHPDSLNTRRVLAASYRTVGRAEDAGRLTTSSCPTTP